MPLLVEHSEILLDDAAELAQHVVVSRQPVPCVIVEHTDRAKDASVGTGQGAPLLGADTETVMTEVVGLSAADVDRLRREKVLY